jgi:hypothetical protein
LLFGWALACPQGTLHRGRAGAESGPAMALKDATVVNGEVTEQR